ncbi:MAG: tetratricopeptide repeat protein [Kordiimonas sp.]
MMKKRQIWPALLSASSLLLTACNTGNNYTVLATPASAQPKALDGTIELKRIADELVAGGDHAAAIPLYRHLGASSGDPTALNALANSLVAQGAHDEATKTLNLLVKRGQATEATWYNLGKVKLASGLFEEALTAFNQADIMRPNHPKTLSGKAISLAALGRTSEAIAAFDTNSDSLTLTNKAMIFAATGQPNAAVALLEPLVRSGKSSARQRQSLAMAYLLDGRDQNAHQLARLDLDSATINETFTFYRSLSSLEESERMQALVTGSINPAWNRKAKANLELKETRTRKIAAQRVVPAKVQTVVAVAKPKPVKDYVFKEIPPLIEPEGWALQIGAYRTIKNLMKGWTILYRKSGDLLQDIPPRRSEVDFGKKDKGPKGFYYRLNAGPLKTFAEAKTLCEALKERGTKCWIRPPETTEGKLPDASGLDLKKHKQAKAPVDKAVLLASTAQ